MFTNMITNIKKFYKAIILLIAILATPLIFIASIQVEAADDEYVELTTGSYSTSVSKYLINTINEFEYFYRTVQTSSNEWGENQTFKLGIDIDFSLMSDTTPVEDAEFKGTFDGDNHTISNMNFVTTNFDYNVGFFEILKASAVVKNVTFSNCSVVVNKMQLLPCAGIVAGKNSGTISNVTVTNSTVMVPGNGGGIVGENYDGANVNGCEVNNSTIYSTYYGGGIIGKANSGEILNCAVIDSAIKQMDGSNITINSTSYTGFSCSNVYTELKADDNYNDEIRAQYCGTTSFGGICGVASTNLKVTNCVFTASSTSTITASVIAFTNATNLNGDTVPSGYSLKNNVAYLADTKCENCYFLGTLNLTNSTTGTTVTAKKISISTDEEKAVASSVLIDSKCVVANAETISVESGDETYKPTEVSSSSEATIQLNKYREKKGTDSNTWKLFNEDEGYVAFSDSMDVNVYFAYEGIWVSQRKWMNDASNSIVKVYKSNDEEVTEGITVTFVDGGGTSYEKTDAELNAMDDHDLITVYFTIKIENFENGMYIKYSDIDCENYYSTKYLNPNDYLDEDKKIYLSSGETVHFGTIYASEDVAPTELHESEDAVVAKISQYRYFGLYPYDSQFDIDIGLLYGYVVTPKTAAEGNSALDATLKKTVSDEDAEITTTTLTIKANSTMYLSSNTIAINYRVMQYKFLAYAEGDLEESQLSSVKAVETQTVVLGSTVKLPGYSYDYLDSGKNFAGWSIEDDYVVSEYKTGTQYIYATTDGECDYFELTITIDGEDYTFNNLISLKLSESNESYKAFDSALYGLGLSFETIDSKLYVRINHAYSGEDPECYLYFKLNGSYKFFDFISYINDKYYTVFGENSGDAEVVISSASFEMNESESTSDYSTLYTVSSNDTTNWIFPGASKKLYYAEGVENAISFTAEKGYKMTETYGYKGESDSSVTAVTLDDDKQFVIPRSATGTLIIYASEISNITTYVMYYHNVTKDQYKTGKGMKDSGLFVVSYESTYEAAVASSSNPEIEVVVALDYSDSELEAATGTIDFPLNLKIYDLTSADYYIYFYNFGDSNYSRLNDEIPSGEKFGTTKRFELYHLYHDEISTTKVKDGDASKTIEAKDYGFVTSCGAHKLTYTNDFGYALVNSGTECNTASVSFSYSSTSTTTTTVEVTNLTAETNITNCINFIYGLVTIKFYTYTEADLKGLDLSTTTPISTLTLALGETITYPDYDYAFLPSGNSFDGWNKDALGGDTLQKYSDDSIKCPALSNSITLSFNITISLSDSASKLPIDRIKLSSSNTSLVEIDSRQYGVGIIELDGEIVIKFLSSKTFYIYVDLGDDDSYQLMDYLTVIRNKENDSELTLVDYIQADGEMSFEYSKMTYSTFYSDNDFYSVEYTLNTAQYYYLVGAPLSFVVIPNEGYKVTDGAVYYLLTENVTADLEANKENSTKVELLNKTAYLGNQTKPLTIYIATEPAKYSITYIVDEEIYQTVTGLSVGDPITNPVMEDRLGYIFSGWLDSYDVMPNSNIIIYSYYYKTCYAIINITSNTPLAKEDVVLQKTSDRYNSLEAILAKTYSANENVYSYTFEYSGSVFLWINDYINKDFNCLVYDVVDDSESNIGLYSVSAKTDDHCYVSGSGIFIVGKNAVITVNPEIGYKVTSLTSGYVVDKNNLVSILSDEAKDIVLELSSELADYYLYYVIDNKTVETETHHYNDPITLNTSLLSGNYISWDNTLEFMPANNVVLRALKQVPYSVIEQPVISKLHAGQKLGEAIVSGGLLVVNGEKVEGEFYFKDSEIVVRKEDSNTKDFEMTFNCTSHPYAPFNITVNITVCNPKYDGTIPNVEIVSRRSKSVSFIVPTGFEFKENSSGKYITHDGVYLLDGLTPETKYFFTYRFKANDEYCESNLVTFSITTLSVDEELYNDVQQDALEKINEYMIIFDGASSKEYLTLFKHKYSFNYSDANRLMTGKEAEALYTQLTDVFDATLTIEEKRIGSHSLSLNKMKNYAEDKTSEIYELAFEKNEPLKSINNYVTFIIGVFDFSDSILDDYLLKNGYVDLADLVKLMADDNESNTYVDKKVDELLGYSYDKYEIVSLTEYKTDFVGKVVNNTQTAVKKVHNCDGTTVIEAVSKKITALEGKTYLDYKFNREEFDKAFYEAAEAAIVAHVQGVVVNNLSTKYTTVLATLDDAKKQLMTDIYNELKDHYENFEEFSKDYYALLEQNSEITYDEVLSSFDNKLDGELVIPISKHLTGGELALIIITSVLIVAGIAGIFAVNVISKRREESQNE